MVRDSRYGHLSTIVLKSFVGLNPGTTSECILFDGNMEAFNSKEVKSSFKMLNKIEKEKELSIFKK